MAFNKRYGIIVAALLGGAALVGGAYYFGTRQGGANPSAKGQPAVPAPQLGKTAAEIHSYAGKLGMADQKGKFAHFRVGNKNVKSIFTEGNIVWIGTSGGVVRYDMTNDTFRLFDNRTGLLSNGVFYVGRVKGQIGVGTYGGGLSLLDETTGKFTNYNVPNGMGDAFVYDVLESKNGDLWIATWSGVNRVRGGELADRSKWDLYTVENTAGGLPNDWVYGLAEGKNGELWLATEGGMARFVDGKWDNWNHSKGIGVPYDVVKSTIEYKNDPGQASVHHAKQKQEMGLEGVDIAFNPNYIVALEVARDGKVWAGTWGGGLTVFDGNGWKNYSSLDGLAGNHVFSLHQDSKGEMWIGTSKGLSRWNGGKIVNMTVADGLFDNNVFSMASTPDGGKWVGSFGGVAYLRP